MIVMSEIATVLLILIGCSILFTYFQSEKKNDIITCSVRDYVKTYYLLNSRTAVFLSLIDA